MLLQILSHTPAWVWLLLAALVALGLTQARASRPSLARTMVMPLAMLSLSLAGVATTFPAKAAAIGAWAAGLALALGLGRALVAARGAAWDAQRRQFAVPGSWLPLGLILTLFMLKYGVGVTLVMQPQLLQSLPFEAAISAAYGLFSGLFLARAISLWLLVRARPQPALAALGGGA